MIKILLVGQNGYLGSYLYEKLSENYYVDTPGGPWRLIDYDYVINCAGLVGVEKCEKSPTKSLESNILLQSRMIDLYRHAKHIFFSSYYVYNYPVACTETDPTTDKYIYMRHKLITEQIVSESGGLVLRLGKLFGHPNLNKKLGFTESVIKNIKMDIDNVVMNPTSLRQVLDVVEFELENRCLYGIYNLANDGNCTHYQFAKRIASHIPYQIEIGTGEVAHRDNLFDSYGNFEMSTQKLRKIIPLRHWITDLDQYMESLNAIL